MAVWGIGVKPARPLAGSMTGYGLPDIASYHAVAMSHIRSVIARHSKPFAQRMPHQYMRHPLVYIATCRSMQEVYLQMLNTTTYAPHGARRGRAVSRVAGGAVLGKRFKN